MMDASLDDSPPKPAATADPWESASAASHGVNAESAKMPRGTDPFEGQPPGFMPAASASGDFAAPAAGATYGSQTWPVGDVPAGAQPHVGAPPPPNALGCAEWVPDAQAINCDQCKETFSTFTRKHHCRQCGQVFCHRCCNQKALLQTDSGTPLDSRVSAHPVFGRNEVRRPARADPAISWRAAFASRCRWTR
jgi:hypothetical protein